MSGYKRAMVIMTSGSYPLMTMMSKMRTRMRMRLRTWYSSLVMIHKQAAIAIMTGTIIKGGGRTRSIIIISRIHILLALVLAVALVLALAYRASVML